MKLSAGKKINRKASAAPGMRQTASQWRSGRTAGFAAGWEQGYRLGCSEAVNRTAAPEPAAVRPVRILFVQSGLWAYRPLDDGIAAALAALTAEVRCVTVSEAIVGQAMVMQPDLVLVLNPVQTLRADQAAALRAAGLRTAIWFTDDPYYSDVSITLAPYYDYVFTLEKGCVALYRDAGCPQVEYLPLAANRGIYYPRRADASRQTEICFIGSAFWNRARFFDEAAGYLSGKQVLISGYWWDRMARFAELQDKIRLGTWMSPEDAADYYNGARIVINLHRAIDDESNANSRLLPALSPNPRTFEIAACGVLQLSDVREGMADCYEPGVEIATYATPAELVEKLEYYLQHPDEGREIALNGLRRTLREHTYISRLQRLLAVIFG